MQVNKETLLNSINRDMKLTKSFFLKVYGYDLDYPGYADTVIQKLAELGCTKAADYYQQIKSEYEQQHEEMLKSVARWYRKHLNGNEREVRQSRNTREKKLLEMKRELLEMKRMQLLPQNSNQ